ncbi:MAG TPA: AbrB family transcriptional regulator [Ramlibacter sp.]|nr:AbrB family transcriptional regulator [Ramlibacter sp.]
MTRRIALRIALTLLAALVAALACRALRVPLPWMIGPLLVTAAASLRGAPTHSWNPLRDAAQWIIGTALGLYFTPEVTALVGRLWWAVLLSIAWTLVLGWVVGAWLNRSLANDAQATPATGYFAGAIGGASEMTLLAERHGGRTDLVAASHSLRLLIVTLGIPFAFALAGLHGADIALPGPRTVNPAGLALLGVLTAVGAGLSSRLRIANPWFIGALLTSMALTMSGRELSAMPTWASNTAQLLIGVSLGVRFRAEFVRTAPRWLAAVACGTVAMVVLSVGMAWLMARLTGLAMPTLVLGTAPGGIAEMAITAKVLQLGVPVVTAFQVCRVVAVLMLVGPAYKWLYRR